MATQKVQKRKVTVDLTYDVKVNVQQNRMKHDRGSAMDDAEFDRRVIRAVRRELNRGGER